VPNSWFGLPITLVMRLTFCLAIWATTCFRQVLAVASYDEYRDADVEQSGYLPNFNMDPSVVDSAAFGQLWKVAFNTDELVWILSLSPIERRQADYFGSNFPCRQTKSYHDADALKLDGSCVEGHLAIWKANKR
jgi:hypothetical protein